MSTAPPASALPVRRELLGAQVHAVTLPEAVVWVRERIARRAPGFVVTLNGALLVQAARDPVLRRIINDAALVTADGIAVVLAARILGVDLRGRLPGVDLVTALCAEAGARHYRVFLLGAAPGVAEASAQALCARHPGITIAGVRHGFFRPEEEEGVRDAIRQARPDLLLVALGAPRQEEWMHRWSAALEVPVSIGVGGTFDVLAGRARRAPAWMQRAGLEWLYRALREPRRWGVVRTIPALFLLALRERWRRLRAGTR